MSGWIIEVYDEALDKWEDRCELGIFPNLFIARQAAKDLEKEEGEWKSIRTRVVPYFRN